VPAPLAGVRVVDLTWVWAGPYSAMQLAHLGAEVVKVESSQRLDVTRVLGPWADGVSGADRSGYFNQYNQGKLGIVLDLKQARGREILRGLLAEADVVIDNMRAGALARMGFSYEELRRLNPRIVAVSMTGFGESGPERDRMAYGSLIDAMSGVASSNGTVGGGPTDFPMSLPDPCAGIHTAIATLAALYRARATGKGERVECAMLEASVAAFPWPVLYQGVVGHAAPVDGNRDEQRAPHDVYRCRGVYEWVAIAVEDDEQFAALTVAIERPDLVTNPRFGTLMARRRHADELDALLSAWTIEQGAEAAAARLRAAGVPAERVAHIDDLFSSPSLLARRFFTELPHPVVGVKQLAGTPWLASRSPMVASTAAPCLGEHQRDVLARWLDLSDADIDEPNALTSPR
jgi:benzylsuccinate CoA-transferase BbsF subunit